MPTYELKVPTGTGEQFQARLAEAGPADMTAFKWYTVKRAETLATIARKLKVSRTDLAEANNLPIKSRVRIGQELIIPRAPTTLLAGRTERTAPAALASRPVAGSATVADAAPRLQSPVVYRVRNAATRSSRSRSCSTRPWPGSRA